MTVLSEKVNCIIAVSFVFRVCTLYVLQFLQLFELMFMMIPPHYYYFSFICEKRRWEVADIQEYLWVEKSQKKH